MIPDKVIFLHALYDWQNYLLTFSSNSNALSHTVGACSVERFSRSPMTLSRVGHTRGGGFISPLAAALQGVVPSLMAFTGVGWKGVRYSGRKNPAPEITAVAFSLLGFPLTPQVTISSLISC